jgi:hypothetical protein
LADRRRNAAAVVAGLGAAGVLLAASIIALGPPNFGAAGQFLSGAYPSMASAVALLSLLSYAVVLASVTVALVRALRMAAGGRGMSRSVRAIALVLAGVILLSLSVVNRVDSGGGICCGGGAQQIREAASLAH